MEGGAVMDNTLSETVIEEIAEEWCGAKSPVVFTGAGVSTDSGIPDYRSPQGEWKKHPQIISTIETFMNQPELFYSYYQNQLFRLVNTQPNPGHRFLAELEERNLVKAVITQNIDNLHQAAGSKNVIELHGTLRTVSCMGCRRRYPSQKMLLEAAGQRPDATETGDYSRWVCPKCKGRLRPDIVLFGEGLPQEEFEKAVSYSTASDFFVVIGSSLTVGPANLLPAWAVEKGARLLIINNEPTPLDPKACWVIRHNSSETMEMIYNKMCVKLQKRYNQS